MIENFKEYFSVNWAHPRISSKLAASVQLLLGEFQVGC